MQRMLLSSSGYPPMIDSTPFFSLADPTPSQAAVWATDLQALLTALGRHFARSEARAHLGAYMTGLLSPLERKNGWQLAEQAGRPACQRRWRLPPSPSWPRTWFSTPSIAA